MGTTEKGRRELYGEKNGSKPFGVGVLDTVMICLTVNMGANIGGKTVRGVSEEGSIGLYGNVLKTDGRCSFRESVLCVIRIITGLFRDRVK